jgi:general secretion pathway protein C
MADGRPRRSLLAISSGALLLAALVWTLGRGLAAPPRDEQPAPAAPAAARAAAPRPDVAAAPAPAAPPGPEREPSAGIPHTRLPLRLLATVVRENPAYSLATLVDTERGVHDVMSEGQPFAGHAKAHIARIERGRVLIDNDGVREQLVIAQGAPPAPDEAELAPSPEERERRRELSQRLRELTDGEREPPGLRERGGLLAEGDVSPVYEDGELVGVHIAGIRPGGVYERIGLRDGDVLTEINGVSLSDPAAAARVLGYVAASDELRVSVEREDGSQQTLSIPTETFRTAVQGLE